MGRRGKRGRGLRVGVGRGRDWGHAELLFGAAAAAVEEK
jgi:hypothetical protein